MLVPDVSIMVKNKSVHWNLIACGLKINPRCPAWSKGMGTDELVASGILSPCHICPSQPAQVLYNIYFVHFIFKKRGGKTGFLQELVSCKILFSLLSLKALKGWGEGNSFPEEPNTETGAGMDQSWFERRKSRRERARGHRDCKDSGILLIRWEKRVWRELRVFVGPHHNVLRDGGGIIHLYIYI